MFRNPDLLRLNLGVFTLHTVQLSMWVAVPAMLVQAGLACADHWQVYLPAVVLSFVAMGGLFALGGAVICARVAGRHGPHPAGAGGLGLLAASGGTPTLWLLGLLLFVFFCGFNALEASQPSLVSRMAPPRCAARRWAPTTPCSRWACLRAAPWAAPWSKWADVPTLFAVTGALCTVWLVLGWGLHPVPRRGQRRALIAQGDGGGGSGGGGAVTPATMYKARVS